jgi:hypothetical protein
MLMIASSNQATKNWLFLARMGQEKLGQEED